VVGVVRDFGQILPARFSPLLKR